MKRLSILIVLALWMGHAALAINGRPLTEETVTVSTSAIGITCGSQQAALIQVKDDAIYFTLESATATPDSDDYNGAVGDWIEVEFPSLFRAIRVTTDAKLKVTCFQPNPGTRW